MVWGERGAWGPWRGERGTGCLTAHSSRLPAPAVGAKPDWILNWKINLDSCELQLLSSPLRQGPSCPYLPPAPAASPPPTDGETEAQRTTVLQSRDASGAAEGSALSSPLSRALCYCFLGGQHRSVLPGWLRATLFIYLRQQAASIPAGGTAACCSRISLWRLPGSRLPLIESCPAKPM